MELTSTGRALIYFDGPWTAEECRSLQVLVAGLELGLDESVRTKPTPDAPWIAVKRRIGQRHYFFAHRIFTDRVISASSFDTLVYRLQMLESDENWPGGVDTLSTTSASMPPRRTEPTWNMN